jgi:hypothetical protein
MEIDPRMMTQRANKTVLPITFLIYFLPPFIFYEPLQIVKPEISFVNPQVFKKKGREFRPFQKGR